MNPVLAVGAMEDLIHKLEAQAKMLAKVKNKRLEGVCAAVLHASPLLLANLERVADELLNSETPPLFTSDGSPNWKSR